MILVFLIACLWACNQSVTDEAQVCGSLENYKSQQVYFEIYGQDSLVKVLLDTAGKFTASLKMSEPAYVRLISGKAAFPLYMKPGMEVQLEIDVARLAEGDYESVVFPEGVNVETRMMASYYQHQWFPSTQEMFVYTPHEFKQMMDTVVRYNDLLIDHFLAGSTEAYDPEFIRLFKLQVKVPFAASYFYYPMYHSLLSPHDSSHIPDDFNIFDLMLPKNDSVVYNKVYRYKTYEVSYWNHLLAAALTEVADQPGKFFNGYIDQLLALNLYPQIREDVAYSFLMPQMKGLSVEAKEVIRKRIKEVMSDARYLQPLLAAINKKEF